MHCHPLIHWKGYPQSRFPRIRFGPKGRLSRSSHSSSSIRKIRQRRVSKRPILDDQIHEEVYEWETPASDQASKSNLVATDRVPMALHSSLLNTGDSAQDGSPRVIVAKDSSLSRPLARASGIAPSTRAIPATVQNQRTSNFRKHRMYDPRISPRRLLKRETPANTVVGSPSIRSFIHGQVSPISQSPSQRRTLRRFARELELHLKAVEMLPKKSLIPSPSITTVHTVEALKPYHSQLLSAGLAVTSTEQRKRPSSLARQKPNSQNVLENRY